MSTTYRWSAELRRANRIGCRDAGALFGFSMRSFRSLSRPLPEQLHATRRLRGSIATYPARIGLHQGGSENTRAKCPEWVWPRTGRRTGQSPRSPRSVRLVGPSVIEWFLRERRFADCCVSLSHGCRYTSSGIPSCEMTHPSPHGLAKENFRLCPSVRRSDKVHTLFRSPGGKNENLSMPDQGPKRPR
jgi:hypothetical protein